MHFTWKPQFYMEGFSPLSDCQKFLSSHSKALNQIMRLSAGFFSKFAAQHNFQSLEFSRNIFMFGRILNLSKKTFSLDNVSSKRFQAITNQIQEILMRYQAERPEKVTPRIQCLGKPRILKCPNHTLWMTKKSNMLQKLQSLL